jgi:hypothetical protein
VIDPSSFYQPDFTITDYAAEIVDNVRNYDVGYLKDEGYPRTPAILAAARDMNWGLMQTLMRDSLVSETERALAEVA